MTIAPCHYDRDLDARITTGRHADTCPTHATGPCPGRWDACAPCNHTHCASCGYRHLDPADTAHPLVCPHCVGQTRTDLAEIRWLCRHLRWHAARAGHDGRLLAAAPIPGGDAQVLMGPTSGDGDDLIWSKHLDEDHHERDVVPPLLPLAIWDTRIRDHVGHRLPAKPSVAGITTYIEDRLTGLAQDIGFDWLMLVTDIAALRRQLERVLHDESEPERGVACFECGDQLVRRFGKPQPCRHRTPGRDHLQQVIDQAKADAVHVVEIRAAAAAAAEFVDTLRTYPEAGPPTAAELEAARREPSYAELIAARRRPTSAEESAARRPCEACSTSRAGQGGLEDPSVGQSWECSSCRKQYSPGEYAQAVRRDLLQSGPSADGWTYISMAAEAASTQTGLPIAQGTVRKWADRGAVPSCCRLVVAKVAGELRVTPTPLKLVYWPDVADAAADLVRRAGELEAERAERAREEQRLRVLVQNGRTPAEAGKAMGLHPNRVRAIVASWDAQTDEAGRMGA